MWVKQFSRIREQGRGRIDETEASQLRIRSNSQLVTNTHKSNSQLITNKNFKSQLVICDELVFMICIKQLFPNFTSCKT